MPLLANPGTYTSILVGTDGGPAAAAVLDRASVIARNHGASLHTVTVCGSPSELAEALRRVAADQRVDAIVVPRRIARRLSGRTPCDVIGVEAPGLAAA